MPESPIDRDAIDFPFEQVAKRLAVVIKGMEPGARLPGERALAEQYGVARDTIRHALEVLTSQGLIVVRAGRGRFVAARQDEAAGQQEAPPGHE